MERAGKGRDLRHGPPSSAHLIGNQKTPPKFFLLVGSLDSVIEHGY
jgi:hypothetical protein